MAEEKKRSAGVSVGAGEGVKGRLVGHWEAGWGAGLPPDADPDAAAIRIYRRCGFAARERQLTFERLPA